jgi:hypothetical protein
MTPVEIRQRFRAVVARAIERADIEHATHLATLRPRVRVRRGPQPPPLGRPMRSVLVERREGDA